MKTFGKLIVLLFLGVVLMVAWSANRQWAADAEAALATRPAMPRTSPKRPQTQGMIDAEIRREEMARQAEEARNRGALRAERLASEAPPDYAEAQIRAHLQSILRDPRSARFDFCPPVRLENGLWRVPFTVNAKNGFGGYSGPIRYRAHFLYGVLAGLEEIQ